MKMLLHKYSFSIFWLIYHFAKFVRIELSLDEVSAPSQQGDSAGAAGDDDNKENDSGSEGSKDKSRLRKVVEKGYEKVSWKF